MLLPVEIVNVDSVSSTLSRCGSTDLFGREKLGEAVVTACPYFMYAFHR